MVEWFSIRVFYRRYNRYNYTWLSSKRYIIKFSQVAELVDAILKQLKLGNSTMHVRIMPWLQNKCLL